MCGGGGGSEISFSIWIALSLGTALYSVIASNGKLVTGWIALSINAFLVLLLTFSFFVIW